MGKYSSECITNNNGRGWGESISSDYNRWCQVNASLGYFLVIGCIPGPARPCLRINITDFEQYRELNQGSGVHSKAIVGDCVAESSAKVKG